MNVLITSDLHYGLTRPSAIRGFASKAAQEDVQAVVIVGDIAETLQQIDWFRQCLDIWRDHFEVPILVIPGNHDLWVLETAKHDSMELYNDILPRITREAGCFWLETENWVKDYIAVVGGMIHYDYTAIDKVGPVAGYSPEFFMKNKSRYINDGRFLRGLPDDIEFAKQIGDDFRKRLLEAQNDPEIDSIIVVTHVPCMEPQVTRDPYNVDWAMSTPYFGNLSHQEAIVRCSKVKYVVSGHSHRGNETTINRGKDPELTVWNLGADYHAPAYKICEL